MQLSKSVRLRFIYVVFVLTLLPIVFFQNCSGSFRSVAENDLQTPFNSSSNQAELSCTDPFTQLSVGAGSVIYSFAMSVQNSQAGCDSSRTASYCSGSTGTFSPAPAANGSCSVPGVACSYSMASGLSAPTGNSPGATVTGFLSQSAVYPVLCSQVTRNCLGSGWDGNIPLHSACSQKCAHPDSGFAVDIGFQYANSYSRSSGTQAECDAARLPANVCQSSGQFAPAVPSLRFAACTVTGAGGTPQVGGGLKIDLSYVQQSSAQFIRFKSMVDAALAGNPDYGFEPQHAAMMYRITNDVRYCDYAITFAENCANSRYAEANCGVAGAEAAIAAGGRAPVSGDSYLEVGPVIGSLAITYDWCAARMTGAQRTRWAAYANQAIYNVWHPAEATWGGRSYPWSGWSIDNPGNNYYYSFLEATMYWALATRDATLTSFVRKQKLQPLVDYYATLPGGGSLEGTGYGAAHMRLFQIYQVWKDSTTEDLANLNTHMKDSIRFWLHATTPNRAFYAPIGDLARSSFPDLFDYHRRIILEARRLTNDVQLQSIASWWLNHISVTQMSRRIEGQWDLLPSGTDTNAAPAEGLTYHATGVGRIFARTGWDTNALWMSFGAGTYNESHAHQDQGGFTLANNAFLAVSNNIYSASGIEQTSDYQNVIRFVQNGNIVRQREPSTSIMTVNQLTPTGEADISANLTNAFGTQTAVSQWTRNVKFAARKLTVTDNFAIGTGTQGVFQVHVPVQPVISGNLITAGTLRIRVLSPANPVIAVVSQGRFRIDISGSSTSYIVELTDQN